MNVEFKKLTQEELDEKFEQHKIYIAAENKNEVEDKRLDLSNCDLRGLKIADEYKNLFIDANLTGTDFSNRKLESMTFKNCNMDRASFYRSYIEDAKFINCRLVDSNLNRTMVYGVEFTRCNLGCISAHNSYFSHIKCEYVDMHGSDLYQAKFAYADLSNISLFGCNLDKSLIYGTDFSKSNIIDGSFVDAYIKDSNFKSAVLSRCNFANASFERTDLRNANIKNLTLSFKDDDRDNISFDNKQLAYMLKFICDMGLEGRSISDNAKKDINGMMKYIDRLGRRRTIKCK